MALRRLSPAAFCAVVVALAGCGDDWPGGHDMQVAYEDADGSGTMFGASDATWSWRTCPDCKPYVIGSEANTRAASPGTVFRATSSDGEKDSSPKWGGNVSPVKPPSVRGAPRANTLLTAVAGTWHGGWEGSSDVPELSACWAADGTGCTTLTHPKYPGCGWGRAVIDPVFTGRYLRVAMRRRPPGEPTTANLVSTPYWPNAGVAGPTISTAVIGRIAPATRPRVAKCGPPALPCPAGASRATCIPATTARISARGTGQVLCPKTNCKVRLDGRQAKRTLRVTRTVSQGQVHAVKLSRRALKTAHGKRLALRLLVAGDVLARRTVTIP